jgi:hypothetical protein
MILDGATNFSGLISGALSLVFEGDASLSGLEDTTGDATLGGQTRSPTPARTTLVANTNIVTFVTCEEGPTLAYPEIRDIRFATERSGFVARDKRVFFILVTL